MSTALVSDRLRSLVLSAIDLRQMRVQEGGFFPEEFISDYLTFLENFIIVAEAIDGEILQDLEEINTEFSNGTVPYVFNNKLIQDNPDFTYLNKVLNLNGTIINLKDRTRTVTGSAVVALTDKIIWC